MKYQPTKTQWSKKWNKDRAELVDLANRMNLASKCSPTCKRRRQCSPALSWVNEFHWHGHQLFRTEIGAAPPCLALLVDQLDKAALKALLKVHDFGLDSCDGSLPIEQHPWLIAKTPPSSPVR